MHHDSQFKVSVLKYHSAEHLRFRGKKKLWLIRFIDIELKFFLNSYCHSVYCKCINCLPLYIKQFWLHCILHLQKCNLYWKKSLPRGLFSPICLETFHCFLSFMLQMGTPVTSSSTASSNSESLSASSKALFPSTAQVRRKLQFKIVKMAL